MSELSFIPNPQVMVVQTVIFFSHIYAVKKLMVEPFLKIKKVRDSMTFGAEEAAEALNVEIDKVSKEVESQLHSTYEELASFRSKAKQQAKKDREGQLTQAHHEMTEILKKTRQDIAHNLDEERRKVDALVEGFVNDIYAAICVDFELAE